VLVASKIGRGRSITVCNDLLRCFGLIFMRRLRGRKRARWAGNIAGDPGIRTAARRYWPYFAGVDLHVAAGEIVSLLGRNGVGRSTTCKAIMGLVPAQGSIAYLGRQIVGLRADQIAHLAWATNRRTGKSFQRLPGARISNSASSAVDGSDAGHLRTCSTNSRTCVSGSTASPGCFRAENSKC